MVTKNYYILWQGRCHIFHSHPHRGLACTHMVKQYGGTWYIYIWYLVHLYLVPSASISGIWYIYIWYLVPGTFIAPLITPPLFSPFCV